MQVICDGDIEKAIQLFTKRVKASGLMKELKQRQSFESRKTKRKKKDQLSLKRMKQRLRRMER